MNDIQKREKEESEIITIGKVTPEIQQRREIENTLIENRKMIEKKREERKKEEQKTNDQLFVINNAKIKMGTHLGIFKVLNDTPTIQGKTVGTKIEKSPANFSFLDGFQVLSVVGDWQDIGTAKYQDNEALIKKSTLTVTGKMPPPNAPIEQSKIEFIDSGQINVVENINTTGMPVPDYVPSPKIIDFYLTDKKDNRIEKGSIGDIVFLHIKTLGFRGKKVSIKLDNPDVDYQYEGKKLNNNTLQAYLIKENEEIIELKVVKP